MLVARIEITAGPGVDLGVLNDLPTESAPGALRVRLGDLVADQEVTLVLAVGAIPILLGLLWAITDSRKLRDWGNEAASGTWALLGGLGIFIVGFLFFEGVIGISGEPLPLPEWVLPAVVIAIGVVVLARGIFQRREPEST